VASTIRPLSREKNPAEVTEKQSETRPVPKPARRLAAPVPVAASRPPRAQTLDSTWDRRLSNGSVEPDRVLDLHGMTLDPAWHAIDRGLEQAIARGDRILLLVTGHHRPGEPPVRRGAIRAAVHDWLAVSRHADRIAAVRGAHPRHGGGGSLYLILRRAGPRQ
jgi:DNA-nicking Smr family endonuclease